MPARFDGPAPNIASRKTSAAYYLESARPPRLSGYTARWAHERYQVHVDTSVEEE